MAAMALVEAEGAADSAEVEGPAEPAEAQPVPMKMCPSCGAVGPKSRFPPRYNDCYDCKNTWSSVRCS